MIDISHVGDARGKIHLHRPGRKKHHRLASRGRSLARAIAAETIAQLNADVVGQGLRACLHSDVPAHSGWFVPGSVPVEGCSKNHGASAFDANRSACGKEFMLPTVLGTGSNHFLPALPHALSRNESWGNGLSCDTSVWVDRKINMTYLEAKRQMRLNSRLHFMKFSLLS